MSTQRASFDLSSLDVNLQRRGDAPPLMAQLLVVLRRAIEDGRLPAAVRLPSSRTLARELSVSRTVVTEVYAMLQAEGYVETRRGSGTYVVQCEDRPTSNRTEPRSEAAAQRGWTRPVEPSAVDPFHEPEGLVSFRICEPEPTSFPDDAWRTCARAAIAEPLPEGYGGAAGDMGLRQAVATWLGRHRGLRCTADEVIITSGTTQSLHLIAALLAPEEVVAFEDPGYRLARQIFTDRGLEVLALPVDAAGPRLDGLRQATAGKIPSVVYTTPSHQFPVGSVLSYGRRRELLDWAACHGALVLEDDYDSEFRFDGPALPALAARDEAGCVAYLGTFSKALAPSLRLGYMVVPPALWEALCRLKTRADHHTSWPMQRALARYVSSGGFERHVRRMGRLYRERRQALTRSLEPLPEGCRWIGLAAGLHATLQVPQGSEAAVVDACRLRGVLVRGLRHYGLGPLAMDGIVLGYGACRDDELADLGRRVRQALVAVHWRENL